RLQKRVGETEVQEVLHRFLAQVVIDAKDAALGEFLQQRAIESLRGSEIAAEGLLHHHACIRRALLAQVADDQGKHTGRNGQVEQRALRVIQRLEQRIERLTLAVVAID